LRKHRANQDAILDAMLADQVADKPGDPTSAVAQAAGLLAETGMPACEYLDELTAGQGKSSHWASRRPTRCRMAAAVEVSMGRRAGEYQAAQSLSDQ